MYNRRFTEPRGSVTTSGVAYDDRVVATSFGESPGFSSKSKATAPATCGAAMDVPESMTVSVEDRWPAERMLTPGAKMSSNVPKLENDARESLDAVAPTVMAEGSDAGENVLASRRLLPAATTMVMPSATALATARFSEVFRLPPRLMLATAGTPAA